MDSIAADVQKYITIMTAAVLPVWAGMSTGGKVFHVRGGIGNHGCTIAGDCKISEND